MHSRSTKTFSFPEEAVSTSIREVAKRAGVSNATVSKVLNGSRETISTETQERVRRAAVELNYCPNAIARSLRRRRTDILGFYSGHPTAYWPVEEIQRGCEQFRKDLLIHGAFRHGSVESIVSQLAEGLVEGLVVVAPPGDSIVVALSEAGFPAVALADATPLLPSVVVDDAAAGRLMAEHLAARGHRRILFRPHYEPRVSGERRGTAFRTRSTELGLEIVIAEPAPHPGYLTEAELALLSASSIRRPTAVACWDDDYMLPVLHGARHLGLRIPDDLAVIGFGGLVFDTVTFHRPTTIFAPWREAAHQAVATLVDILEGKEVPSETVLPVQLIIGDTT